MAQPRRFTREEDHRLLKVRPDFYAQGHPSLEDLLLPGEMAEASFTEILP